MSMSIESEAFSRHLNEGLSAPELATLCDEIRGETTGSRKRSIDVAPVVYGLATLVAPPLWLWACIELDDLKNRKNTSVAERRIAMVLSLQEQHGYKQKDAELIVEKTLSAVEKRNKNDGAVAAILKIAKEVKLLPTRP